mgnify:CR=1 FL=1
MGRTLWHRQCFDTCGVLQLELSGSRLFLVVTLLEVQVLIFLLLNPLAPEVLDCVSLPHPPRDGLHWAWNCRHTWPAPSPHARTLSCLQTEILLKALYINIKLILKDHPWLISSHLLKDTVHVYTVSLFCMCTSEHSSCHSQLCIWLHCTPSRPSQSQALCSLCSSHHIVCLN